METKNNQNQASRVQIRQGDVLLSRIIDEVMVGVKPKDGMLILAEGELTGHAHRVSASDARLVHDTGGGMVLEVFRTTRLLHEEHAPVELLPGAYEVTRQREYDPNGDETLVGD